MGGDHAPGEVLRHQQPTARPVDMHAVAIGEPGRVPGQPAVRREGKAGGQAAVYGSAVGIETRRTEGVGHGVG